MTVSMTEEPEYRYGPQVRLIRDYTDEHKMPAASLNEGVLEAYEHTPEWALDAVLDAGYDVVYKFDHSVSITSFEELEEAVRADYDGTLETE